MPDPYDVAIVGGGLTGAALACALRGHHRRIALVDASVPRSTAVSAPGGSFAPIDQSAFDARTISLAYGSRRILEGMGLWNALADHATPIRHVHVSDREGFGFTRMDARASGVQALGYVAEAEFLGAVMARAVAESPDIEWIPGARVVTFVAGPQAAEIEVERAGARHRLCARLVVGADGGDSTVRECAGIRTVRREYGQTAVVTTVTPQRAHHGWAFERFTPTGPLALLPLSHDRCAVVWCARNDETEGLLALSDAEFLDALGERFGGRLGRFLRVGARQSYPLVLIWATEQVRPRLVLLGNAAHTVHPVGAQGFNLALRDVAALAESVHEAVRRGEDPGEESRLHLYEQQRHRDQRQVVAFTEGVARLFSSDFGPLRIARNLGLVALDLLPTVKRRVVRRAMGLNGRQPRLARGLPLA